MSMTVKELINELGRFNENAEVHLNYGSRSTGIGFTTMSGDGVNETDVVLFIADCEYD